MDTNIKMRNNKLDNIKGLLIILVVLGHLLELDMEYGVNKFLYVIIYTFHMPVFVFVSGYFASFNIKRILKKLLYPYILFQILYLLFVNYVLNLGGPIQFTTPYWLLWYLWAMVIWTLMIPVIKGKLRRKIIIILIAGIIAISIGYVNSVGRMFSLSRIFVFFPFFLCGYYAREWISQPINKEYLQNIRKKYKKRLISAMCICIMGIIIYCMGHYNEIDRNWLYEAVSYQDGTYRMEFRVLHLGMAFIWLASLLLIIPNRYIPLLTNTGINTMPIFLMHGFLIKMIGKYKIINQWKELEYIMLFSLLSCIVVLLSSRPFCIIFENLIRIPELIGKFIIKKR